MIHYEKQDTVLSNIAVRFAKRLQTDEDITLVLDRTLGEKNGKIENNVISGGAYDMILEGCGRYLRHGRSAEGSFCSHKSMCAIYFATHFNNYLDAAPLDELFAYIDDLAFWGMGVLKLWFDMHHFKNMEEDQGKSSRVIAIMRYAKSIGLKTVLTTLSNEAFADSPKELRADWTSGHDGYIYDLNDHYHLEICPSKPGGMEQILSDRKKMLDVFREAQPDYISICGYDEGGCTCSSCAPWGCNGHLRVVDQLIPLYKSYFPNVKIIMSLWQFGTFTGTDVEFEGVYAAAREGRLDDVAYFLSEPQYARYPFEHEPVRPIINFPEISMYNASPWGGYGANPMPQMLDDLWKKDGDKLEGGYPYSEGIYEDINKIIMLRLYRENQPVRETVREYLAYEFGLDGAILDHCVQAVYDMEETLKRQYDPEETLAHPHDKEAHRYVIEKPEKIESILSAMEAADAVMEEAKRSSVKWQMLYLRAKIDAALKANDFYRNDTVMGYFRKLIELAHLQNSGQWTKPDIMGV